MTVAGLLEGAGRAAERTTLSTHISGVQVMDHRLCSNGEAKLQLADFPQFDSPPNVCD